MDREMIEFINKLIYEYIRGQVNEATGKLINLWFNKPINEYLDEILNKTTHKLVTWRTIYQSMRKSMNESRNEERIYNSMKQWMDKKDNE